MTPERQLRWQPATESCQDHWRPGRGPACKPLCSHDPRLGTRLARIPVETVPIMPSPLHRALAGFVLLTLPLGACVSHDPEPAFRASVLIDDRGISIPLPPPSLVDEPEQEVDVEGEVIGLHEEAAAGLTVRIVDSMGGSELDVPLEDGSSAFRGEGLAIDLRDNCIELWLVGADGREGERAQYQAVIDESGTAVAVIEGCDD